MRTTHTALGWCISGVLTCTVFSSSASAKLTRCAEFLGAEQTTEDLVRPMSTQQLNVLSDYLCTDRFQTQVLTTVVNGTRRMLVVVGEDSQETDFGRSNTKSMAAVLGAFPDRFYQSIDSKQYFFRRAKLSPEQVAAVNGVPPEEFATLIQASNAQARKLPQLEEHVLNRIQRFPETTTRRRLEKLYDYVDEAHDHAYQTDVKDKTGAFLDFERLRSAYARLVPESDLGEEIAEMHWRPVQNIAMEAGHKPGFKENFVYSLYALSIKYKWYPSVTIGIYSNFVYGVGTLSTSKDRRLHRTLTALWLLISSGALLNDVAMPWKGRQWMTKMIDPRDQTGIKRIMETLEAQSDLDVGLVLLSQDDGAHGARIEDFSRKLEAQGFHSVLQCPQP